MSEFDVGDHGSFDVLHRELMQLLDRIETREDYTLASERFAIMESHGYKTVRLTGPTGLVE